MSALFELIQTANITWKEGRPLIVSQDNTVVSAIHGVAQKHRRFVSASRLMSRIQTLLPSTHVVLANTSFGSALSFLLMLSLWEKHAPKNVTLHYIASEPCPWTRDDIQKCIALWPSLKKNTQHLLAHYPVLTPGFHSIEFPDARVHLTLFVGEPSTCYQELLVCGNSRLEPRLRHYHVDAWVIHEHDLFTDKPFLATVGMLSKPKTTLTTFCEGEDVQQGLQQAGFTVQPWLKLMRAEFTSMPHLQTTQHTPWHVASPAPTLIKEKTAIVLGAGLAGCYMASALARRGWSVTLLDAEGTPADGASGNKKAILYPKLTPFSSPLNAFMLNAHQYAFSAYQQMLKTEPLGELCGILQLASYDKDTHLEAWVERYPELGILVSQERASCLAGIELQSGGVFIPRSGWVNSPMLCQYLINNNNIHWVGHQKVVAIHNDGKKWHANGHEATVLVIANGSGANVFEQTKHLPLTAVRGQMTSMLSNEQSVSLKIPVCADIHVLPAEHGCHEVGATYQAGVSTRIGSSADDLENMMHLHTISSEVAWSCRSNGSWVGVRAATPDYLPMVGPVVKPSSFKQCYKHFATDAKRWIPEMAMHHEGLYVCAGFGSRGLTTIPLSAEWLAATISQEPFGMPRTMSQSLSPSRFLRREIIRSTLKK